LFVFFNVALIPSEDNIRIAIPFVVRQAVSFIHPYARVCRCCLNYTCAHVFMLCLVLLLETSLPRVVFHCGVTHAVRQRFAMGQLRAYPSKKSISNVGDEQTAKKNLYAIESTKNKVIHC